MGGGGGVFHNKSAEDYKELIRRIREKSQDSSFETDVNEEINQRLGSHNARDTRDHQERLGEIIEIIREDVGGTIELRFGGSVSKHTYVDGLSDVDVLILIDRCELADKSPKAVLKYVKRILEGKLRNAESVEIGRLAITVKYSDGTEIQLLPAIRLGDGYKISKAKSNDWSDIIRPDKFASRLTDVNRTNNGKVVPVIKLVKSINAQLPEDQQLTGYHIESLAIAIFRSYPEGQPHTPKAMLKYFFDKAREKVKTPIKDRTGQSLHVDDYLGDKDSPDRIKASYNFHRTFNRMKNADEVRSKEEWVAILDGA